MRDGERTVPRVSWPEGKTFAFTIFDDPDGQELDAGRRVYGLLGELGFRTTRGVWPGRVRRERNSRGETCENPEYVRHTQGLQAAGFDVGFHNAAPHSSTREEIVEALEAFREYFGHDPVAMANHYNRDAMYWGPARLSPPWRAAYAAASLGRTVGVHFGEVEGDRSFWGDLCRERIGYCRNFVYARINTLAACPWMPYHDPLRPYVNAWYSSSEGSNVARFTRMLAEANQDALEAEGGACIMYTHFGHGFVDERGRLKRRFELLMRRLSRKNGWFVPVPTLLGYLAGRRPPQVLTAPERHSLERRWLWEKLFRGTS